MSRDVDTVLISTKEYDSLKSFKESFFEKYDFVEVNFSWMNDKSYYNLKELDENSVIEKYKKEIEELSLRIKRKDETINSIKNLPIYKRIFKKWD